jgi:hypothetical protein
MRCEDIQDDVIDVTSPDFVSMDAGIRRHVENCEQCRAVIARAARTWTLLTAIPDEEPDSPAMRARFADSLTRQQKRGVLSWLRRPPVYAAAAILVAFVGGAAAGRQWSAGDEAAARDVNAMRAELRDVREMLTLSLMQQTVASERIRGVSAAAHMDDPPSDVVAALLDTLAHDPSVNVRLASIRALERFNAQSTVRAGVTQAVTREAEPLVSIALIDFIVAAKDSMAVAALRMLSEDPGRDNAVREAAARGVRLLSGGRI